MTAVRTLFKHDGSPNVIQTGRDGGVTLLLLWCTKPICIVTIISKARSLVLALFLLD